MRAELGRLIEKGAQSTTLLDTEKELSQFFKQKADLLIPAGDDPFAKPFLRKAAYNLQALKDLLLQEDAKDAVIKRALKRAFNSEFYAELSPMYLPGADSKILMSEGGSTIFEIAIKDNDIQSFNLADLFYFEDVTFIETPVLLQMYDVVRYADTLFELDSKESRLQSLNRPKVSLHIKDLMAKMEQARYDLPSGLFSSKTLEDGLLNKISEMVGGNFSFDEAQRDFVFKKNFNGGSKHFQVRASNTASGIKSFGMIQLLLQANFIDRRSLLIVDEPETHLHPKWQVEYARLIVEMVKAEIPVLLTSHSPYMVQALKVFSQKAGIADLTNFYLSERNPETPGAVMYDVTNDLNRLFQKLSEPLQQIVWQ